MTIININVIILTNV